VTPTVAPGPARSVGVRRDVPPGAIITAVPTRPPRRFAHPTILAAIIAAVAAVAAAAIPVVAEVLRNPTPRAAPDPPPVAAPASPPAVAPTGSPVAAPGSSDAAAPTGGAAAPAPDPDVRALGDMSELGDFEGWSAEPQQVAGARHETVLAASPCWLNDDFTATFVVGRQYSRFEAAVGIADDARVARPLRFTVLVDDKPVFQTTAGLGRTRPVRVTISGATQLGIRVSTTSTDQCHGDTVGVWINPEVHR